MTDYSPAGRQGGTPRPGAPSLPARLSPEEVQVWRACLDCAPDYRQELVTLLSADEQERSARFRFAPDRERFVVGRGLLRLHLGRYLGEDPRQLRFHYNAWGKPSLAGAWRDVRFNLSHADGLALYAFTLGREVGIDVERLRPDLDHRHLAQCFFAPAEVAALTALPTALQTDAFFACWTRKEAYIKARGEGLSFPLDQFAVSLLPGEPAALLRVPGNPQELVRWSLQTLTPAPGFLGALAVEGHDWQLVWRGDVDNSPLGQCTAGRS